MDSRQDVRAFLKSGAWVPLDAAAQLTRQLQMLRAWVQAHKPLDLSVEQVIKIELADLAHLLDRGKNGNLLVPAERWQDAVQEIQLLRKWLTSLP